MAGRTGRAGRRLRASGGPCRAWPERLRTPGLDGLAVHQVAVVDEVPGLLRGMVASSIRKGVPPALHERFLLVTEQAQAWKKLSGHTWSDVPYVLLLDTQHTLRWHAAGDFNEPTYRALRSALSQLAGAN